MKKNLVLIMLALFAVNVGATIVYEDNFDVFENYGGDWEYAYATTDSSDSFVEMGWWWYNWVQTGDVGLTFQADTVYTYTMEARAGAESTLGTAGGYPHLQMSLAIGDGTQVVAEDFNYDMATFGPDSPWGTYSVTFDTAANPSVVGETILMSWVTYDVGDGSGTGGNHINSITLEAVPEPATFALMGVGIACLRRRRK